jgi:hypothetical protein
MLGRGTTIDPAGSASSDHVSDAQPAYEAPESFAPLVSRRHYLYRLLADLQVSSTYDIDITKAN